MSWLDECEVRVVQGDLFAQPVEAIVVPVECTLSLNHKLGHELVRRAGEGFRERVQLLRDANLGGRLGLGQSTSVPVAVRGLPVHAILVAWWGADNDYKRTHIEKCLSTSLREALRLQVASLVYPLFGTGSIELRREDLYRAISVVLGAFNALKNSDAFLVREVRFVCDKGEYVEELAQHLAMELPR